MIFTVVVWIGSAILLLIAAVMYIPLLCYIQGNLKEYCCHKIDKRFVSLSFRQIQSQGRCRIAELMKKKTRKRLAQEAARARKEAAGDFAHLKDKKGNLRERPMAQPTLPKINMDDDRKYSSTSDLSLRKDPAYFQSNGSLASHSHAYPPPVTGWNQNRYNIADIPPPQAPYAGSDYGGYEGSIHSVDRLIPSNDGYQEYRNVPPYTGSSAPAYKSQTSLHHQSDSKHGWDEPTPPMPSNQYTDVAYSTQQQPGGYFPQDQYPQHRGGRSPQLTHSASRSQQLAGFTSHPDSGTYAVNDRHSIVDEPYQPISRAQLLQQAASGGGGRDSGSAYGGMTGSPSAARPESEFYSYYEELGHPDRPNSRR